MPEKKQCMHKKQNFMLSFGFLKILLFLHPTWSCAESSLEHSAHIENIMHTLFIFCTLFISAYQENYACEREENVCERVSTTWKCSLETILDSKLLRIHKKQMISWVM